MFHGFDDESNLMSSVRYLFEFSVLECHRMIQIRAFSRLICQIFISIDIGKSVFISQSIDSIYLFNSVSIYSIFLSNSFNIELNLLEFPHSGTNKGISHLILF